LGDTGRLILRPSGTEPLIRVTLEGTDEAQVNQLAQELANIVRKEL
jgi:phosphoglucosamine mutase